MLKGSLNQRLGESSKNRLNYFKFSAQKEHLNYRKKNILHRMIEIKARLQFMVSDIKTIKDGITYGSMEASKTLERQSNIFDQFYFQIGVKMHSDCLDCIRPCTIVAFRVLLQYNIA